MRAISTVLDGTVFLLLVAAAVITLSLGGAVHPATGSAADVADVLASSTATIQYSLAPGVQAADSSVVTLNPTQGPEVRRIAHGTLAGHLATAAVTNLSVDGTAVTHTRDGFRRAVANATRNVTRGRDRLASIRAVWRPYPGSPIRGVVRVGPRPDPSVTVHTATFGVDSGFPDAREAALRAAEGGNVSTVSATIAERIVDGVFPVGPTRAALLGDYPAEQLVTYRYERLGRVLGTNVTERAVANDVTGANAELADALAERLERHVRTRFDSPTAAARAVSVDTVRITVRTWSP